MRVPKINLYKYNKSLNRTQKVIRTTSKINPYIPKRAKLEAEMDQKILASLEQQKEFDKELEKLTNMIEDHRASEIQYYALLLYGIKIDKEKVLEIIKARKAK